MYPTNPQTKIIIMTINIFLVINQTNKSIKQRYIIITGVPKLLWKKFYFFSLQSIRMSRENIKFNDKKIKISDFYINKNKKIFNIDDIDVGKILV